MLLQKAVNILNLLPRSCRNAFLAGTVDCLWKASFARCHRIDQRNLAANLLFVGAFLQGGRVDVAGQWQLLEHRSNAAHIHHLFELFFQVGQIETLPFLQLARQLFRLVLADLLLDQARLADGRALDDPGAFVQRLNRVMLAS